MQIDENIERVERRGWIVDRDASYRDPRPNKDVDHLYGEDASGNYGVGVDIDWQSGDIKDAIIVKDPNGEDRETRKWECSIPTPQQVADAFEHPQSMELRNGATR